MFAGVCGSDCQSRVRIVPSADVHGIDLLIRQHCFGISRVRLPSEFPAAYCLMEITAPHYQRRA
jgi:hypothetical protein